jgi:hypothetical protein
MAEKQTQPDSKALWAYTIFAIVGTILTLLALALDPRMLAGEPVWLKPLKFFLSTLIFVPTLEFGLARTKAATRHVNLIRRVVASGLLFEMLVICTQAFRGVRSHFNFATPVDGALFAAMGIVISIVVLFVGWGAILILRSSFAGSSTLKQALGWGLLVFVVAAFLGTQMPKPTPSQRKLLESGQASPTIGSHFVGSEEGSNKVSPLTAWSLESGDLRVTHFVGMHVPQLLLALVWILRRRRWNLNSTQTIGFVRVGAGLGFLAMGLTFVQAKLAESVFNLGTNSALLLMLTATATLLIFVRAAIGPKGLRR